MISVEELEKFHPEKYQRNDIGTSNLFTTVYADSFWFMSLNGKAFSFMTGKCGVRMSTAYKPMSLQKNSFCPF